MIFFFEIKTMEKTVTKEQLICDPAGCKGSTKSAQTSVLEGVLHLVSPGRDTIGTLASPQVKEGCRKKPWRRCMTTRPAHLNLQACSVRRRRTMGICLALAFASWHRKLLVSPDQRPPTSPASTTSCVRARCPTSSGYVRSFLRRATATAAPSTCATLARADPSQCRTDTNVVSMA